jgi:hypothetical protein
MKSILQYNTQEERDSLISAHNSLILIEEQNITEGNFLIFSDNPTEDTKQVVYINVAQTDFDKQKNDLELLQKAFDEFTLGV